MRRRYNDCSTTKPSRFGSGHGLSWPAWCFSSSWRQRSCSFAHRALCAAWSPPWRREPEAAIALLLAGERRPRRRQLLLLCGIDLRVAQVKLLHRFHDRGRDYEPGEPFIVRRHDEPGCSWRRGGADRFFEGVHVVCPEASLADVGGREFPVLVRPV